jgi:DNA-binding NarL/FixJ family response regulator
LTVFMSDCHISEPAIRILVVDDFELWRRHLIGQLQKRPGFQVVAEASDGPEALRKVEQLEPSVIILDVGLPGMDGIAVTSAILRVTPKSRILVISAHNNGAIARAVFRAGAHGYLLKTDAGRELIPAMEAVLRGDLFVSHTVASDFSVGEDVAHVFADRPIFDRIVPRSVRISEKPHRIPHD